jgi:hypothetical protein
MMVLSWLCLNLIEVEAMTRRSKDCSAIGVARFSVNSTLCCFRATHKADPDDPKMVSAYYLEACPRSEVPALGCLPPSPKAEAAE